MSGINGEVYEALNELTVSVKEWLKKSDQEQEDMRVQSLRLDALEKEHEMKLKEVYLAKSREITRKESEFQRRNAQFAEQRNRVNEFREQYYAQRDKAADAKGAAPVKSSALSAHEKVWSRKEAVGSDNLHVSGENPYSITAASGRYRSLVDPVLLAAPKRKSKKPERTKQHRHARAKNLGLDRSRSPNVHKGIASDTSDEKDNGLLTSADKKLVSRRHAEDLGYGANARASGRTTADDRRENDRRECGRHTNEWRSKGNIRALAHATKKRPNIELRSRSRRSRSRHRSKRRHRERSRRHSHSSTRSKENRKARRNSNKSNDRKNHRAVRQHSPSRRSRKGNHSRSHRHHRNRSVGDSASSRSRSLSVASSRSRHHADGDNAGNGVLDAASPRLRSRLPSARSERQVQRLSRDCGGTCVAACAEIPCSSKGASASAPPTVRAKTSSPPRERSVVRGTHDAPSAKTLSTKNGRTISDDKRSGAAVVPSIQKTRRKSSPVADVKKRTPRSRSASRSSRRSGSLSKSLSKRSNKDDEETTKSRTANTLSRSPGARDTKEPIDSGTKTGNDKSCIVKETIAKLVV